MFQFTTTTVINENKDFTTGKAPLFEAEDGVLKIKRHNNFKKDNILAIYKRAATDPVLAEVQFTIPSTLTAGYYRIALYVRLSGNNNAYYANDFVFKGKPLFIEFEVTEDNEAAATVAARIVENAHKYMLMVYENDILDVASSGSTLTITAVDEYQRITKAELQYFNSEAGIQAMGGYMGEFENILTATVVEYGAEGFGTYSHIIKDLRLPTAANTRWTRIVQDETPIPGAKYNQYTLYYCVNRGIMGSDAVGEVVKSRTAHVFYVNTNISDDFETALAEVGTVVTISDNETGDYDESETLPDDFTANIDTSDTSDTGDNIEP